MGLKLRYSLFRHDKCGDVVGAYKAFYAARKRPLQDSGSEDRRLDFHEADQGWVVVNLDWGWEWKERREAQWFVSQRLRCAGFMVFVFDGDYWGYEFFDSGQVLDQFVQESTENHWFPDKPITGQAGVVARQLGTLREEELAAYLVQSHDWIEPDRAKGKARPGDEFDRFDECAVLDFLRMLGVQVSLVDQYVKLQSPIHSCLWLNTHG